ncbi:hypothetical protein GCM10009674_24980 [Nesterenkonia xinjiangensis]
MRGYLILWCASSMRVSVQCALALTLVTSKGFGNCFLPEVIIREGRPVRWECLAEKNHDMASVPLDSRDGGGLSGLL